MFDLKACSLTCENAFPFFSLSLFSDSLGQNRDRSPHCIQTSETECDLTQQLKNLKHIRETYTAVVQSESARGVPSDIVEPPYTESKKFCPYTDSRYPSTIHSILEVNVHSVKMQISI